MNLHHLTLNTGHTRVSCRTEVHKDVLDVLTPLVANKRGTVPGFSDFNFDVIPVRHQSAVLTVYRGDVPLSTTSICWAAGEAEFLWRLIERTYFQVTENHGISLGSAEAIMPESAPWVATILFPTIQLYPESAKWMADFIRCIAWTLIENSAEESGQKKE